MADHKQFCTFRVDDLFFGVEVAKVQEVLRFQEMTSVPLAPKEVRGLINLRGQIVTAIDLRPQLGLPARKPDQQPMNVVLRTAEGGVSLLVDEIGDVVEVEEETFEPPPESLGEEAVRLILGVHKLEHKLLHVLDTEHAIEILQDTATVQGAAHE